MLKPATVITSPSVKAWRKVDASYGKESPEVQAGEFLAHMAEKSRINSWRQWERVVALVKGVLRRTGLLKPTELNDIRLVRETIRTLGLRVREGYTPREDGAAHRLSTPVVVNLIRSKCRKVRASVIVMTFARMMKSLRFWCNDCKHRAYAAGIAPPWRTRFAAGYLPRHCAEGNQCSETCGANGCLSRDFLS